MSVAELYRAYREGARAAEVTQRVGDGVESALYVAIWAHATGDLATARESAGVAVECDSGSEFARLLVRYLHGAESGPVYDSPAAFRAFIRGGGNVPLYEATSAALRDVYRRWRPDHLLDIGVGDGLALLPALGDEVLSVDVVEPSEELLAETVAGLRRRGIRHRAVRAPVQEFIREYDGQRWDLAQSTFAMQSLPPADRERVVRWVAGHARTFVLVEFDVPEAPDPFDPEWFRSCLRRTEQGLREYGDDRDLVGTGFILPVILGHFRADQRANYERAIDDWKAELGRGGFPEVTSRKLVDYWWRPAYVVQANR